MAGVLLGAAHQAGWNLYLALVSIAESGWAEYAGGGGYRGRYWDASSAMFEIGPVEDSSETVHDWRHPDGSRPPLGPLPFDTDELCPPDAFEDLEPDELDFHEATGNEGATFERLYQRAALVLWPRSHQIGVLAQGGLEATVPFLGELAGQWEATDSGREDSLWQEAHRLAAQIRRDWPEAAWERQRASRAGHAEALLRHLADLGDLEEIDAFLAERTASGAYGSNDNESLAAALGRLSPTRAGDLLTAIVTHNAPAQAIACGCGYCQDLSHFLADRSQSTWLLKAAQAARSHVEASIRSNSCDLDYVTEERGRPYTLRCTKNQASYQRRVEQRRQDLAHLAQLEGKTGDGGLE